MRGKYPIFILLIFPPNLAHQCTDGYVGGYWDTVPNNSHQFLADLLKHAPFIYCKLANFTKCCIIMWILIFSIMKKVWDVGLEKLINMIGRHWHFGYIHGCQPYPRNDHLCSKSAQKR